jgi:uncharacterized protein with gpF-like domain
LRGSYEKNIEEKMNDLRAYQHETINPSNNDNYQNDDDHNDETYKKYVDAIEITKKDYENYKINLPQDDRELANVIETKLERLNGFRIDLLKEKFRVRFLIFLFLLFK